MKKLILYAAVLILSTYIMQSVLPGQGIKGLINGVNTKNNMTIMASDFFFMALVSFFQFGKTEKYLCGYGKYQLLRYKSRTSLLIGITIKAFIVTLGMCVVRIIIYVSVLMIKGEKVFDTSSMDILYFFVVCLSVVFILSLVQIYFELQISAVSGVVIVLAYYIASVVLGGVLLENKKTMPVWFLLANYPMKYRGSFINRNYSNIALMIVVLILMSIIMLCLCKRAINRKDIF